MPDLIRIEHLCKSYQGKKVLEDFSLTLETGRITAVMAPSGAGKTTLLRILMGLETPDSGFVRGMEGLRLSAVFQEDRLCGNLNMISNLRLAAGRELSDEAISDAMHAVGLWEPDDAPDSAGYSLLGPRKNPFFPKIALRPVRGLSGGQRRRVALLRALLVSWDLLLLDEPFRGLDAETRLAAMDYTLSCFRRQPGRTVLLITHDQTEADHMADSVTSL